VQPDVVKATPVSNISSNINGMILIASSSTDRPLLKRQGGAVRIRHDGNRAVPSLLARLEQNAATELRRTSGESGRIRDPNIRKPVGTDGSIADRDQPAERLPVGPPAEYVVSPSALALFLSPIPWKLAVEIQRGLDVFGEIVPPEESAHGGIGR